MVLNHLVISLSVFILIIIIELLLFHCHFNFCTKHFPNCGVISLLLCLVSPILLSQLKPSLLALVLHHQTSRTLDLNALNKGEQLACHYVITHGSHWQVCAKIRREEISLVIQAFN